MDCWRLSGEYERTVGDSRRSLRQRRVDSNDPDDEASSVDTEDKGEDHGDAGDAGDGAGGSTQQAALTQHGAHASKMKGRIADAEQDLLAEKPWMMRGEVHGKERPENR